MPEVSFFLIDGAIDHSSKYNESIIRKKHPMMGNKHWSATKCDNRWICLIAFLLRKEIFEISWRRKKRLECRGRMRVLFRSLLNYTNYPRMANPKTACKSRIWLRINFAHLSCDLGWILRTDEYNEQQSVNSHGLNRSLAWRSVCFSLANTFFSAAWRINVDTGTAVWQDLHWAMKHFYLFLPSYIAIWLQRRWVTAQTGRVEETETDVTNVP